jgi:hypothetical protein
MNKYQKALDNLKTMGDKDLYNERNTEWCNILQELVDKETPKKPIIRGLSGVAIHTCPVCNKELIVTNDEIVIYKTKTNYCDECGQRLDWGDE